MATLLRPVVVVYAGNDVVIVGRGGAGRSWTMNSLRGVRFRVVVDGKLRGRCIVAAPSLLEGRRV